MREEVEATECGLLTERSLDRRDRVLGIVDLAGDHPEVSKRSFVSIIMLGNRAGRRIRDDHDLKTLLDQAAHMRLRTEVR